MSEHLLEVKRESLWPAKLADFLGRALDESLVAPVKIALANDAHPLQRRAELEASDQCVPVASRTPGYGISARAGRICRDKRHLLGGLAALFLRVYIGNHDLIDTKTCSDRFVEYPSSALEHADVEGVTHELTIYIGDRCA